MNKKLYVGNLSYQTTQDSLQKLFATVGQVVSASIVEDRETGRSKGFGFVEMADETGAAAAVEQLNGKQLDGRTIRVSEANPPRPREDRGGGGGGGRDSRDSRGPRRW